VSSLKIGVRGQGSGVRGELFSFRELCTKLIKSFAFLCENLCVLGVKKRLNL
jgi:hypothetical protein